MGWECREVGEPFLSETHWVMNYQEIVYIILL